MFLNKNYVFDNQDIQIPVHLNFGKFILDHIRTIKDDRIAIVSTYLPF